MNAAEVAKAKAKSRASLEECVAILDTKPPRPLFTALRREFAAVLAVWDAEEALTKPSASKPTAPAAATTAPKASPNTTKKGRSWLLKLLPS